MIDLLPMQLPLFLLQINSLSYLCIDREQADVNEQKACAFIFVDWVVA